MKAQKVNMVIGTALSIHPRSWYMVDKTYHKGEKSNTAKTKSPAKVAAQQAHCGRHPKDGKAAIHLKKREA